MQDWHTIDQAPRDGRNLLAYNSRYLNGLDKNHPMRFWRTNLLLSGNYYHPKMDAMDLSRNISSDITEDMIPTHFIEISFE